MERFVLGPQKEFLAWATREAVDADVKSKNMIDNLVHLPFVKHVRIMPDFHLGKGAVIGSVLATTDCVIPMAVGSDIGCGMTATLTTLTVDDLSTFMLDQLKVGIMHNIPMGRNNNGKRGVDTGGHRFAITGGIDSEVTVFSRWTKLLHENYKFRQLLGNPKCKLINDRVNTYNHLGTLGTGNHFIEICVDELGRIWIFIHSGSRGIGGRVGNYYTKKAKEHMVRYHIDLPDKELAYLPVDSEDGRDYLAAMEVCQQFAEVSRSMMSVAVLDEMNRVYGGEVRSVETISCHHNFATWETHYGKNLLVTRKGAIHVPEGKLGLIPGSMGRKSYVVEGLGSKASLDSASHGAGRLKSRTAAKKDHCVDELRETMAGVVWNDEYATDLVDEISESYKPIDEVMDLQKDLVKPVHTLRALICLKGQG